MPDAVQVLLNSIFSFVSLFIIAKLLGKKQVAQLTVVDYVIGISLGSISAQWCTDAKNPWYFYAIGLGVFFIFSITIDFFERKAPIGKLLKGSELVLFSNGKIDYKNLKKSKLDIQDLLGLCRQKGYFDMSQIQCIMFENNGGISVLPKGEERQIVAKDLKEVKIEKAEVAKHLIIDGRVEPKNLKVLKHNKKWLFDKCKIKSKNDLKNIILAEYINDEITVYKK